MNILTLLFAVMLIRALPESVSAEAVAAAASAQESAAAALAHNYGLSIDSTTNRLVVTMPADDNE